MKCKDCVRLFDIVDENGNPDGKWCTEICDSPDTEIDRDCHRYKYMTNADSIRNMTDEELAEFLLKVNEAYAEDCMIGIGDCKYEGVSKNCKDCFLEWLQKIK